MSGSIQIITYNIASQTVSLDVLEGRPSSATFAVYREDASDDDTAEFSGNGTVDSVNTTLTAAAGFSQTNRRLLTVGSTSSFAVGQEYLLTGTLSQSERFECVKIDSGNLQITTRHPLQNDYASASTVQGTRITGTVDSTFVADETNITLLEGNPGYRVLWTFTVNSAQTKRYTYFSLVRAQVTHTVTARDVSLLFPKVEQIVPSEYRGEGMRTVLNTAHERVLVRLKGLGVEGHQVREQRILDELVKRQALVILAYAGYKPAGFGSVSEYLAVVAADFEATLETHFGQGRTPVAIDTSGASATVTGQPVWYR